jgi:hypothetical protein
MKRLLLATSSALVLAGSAQADVCNPRTFGERMRAAAARMQNPLGFEQMCRGLPVIAQPPAVIVQPSMEPAPIVPQPSILPTQCRWIGRTWTCQ